MKELIPVAQSTFGSETIPTVNARDLHAFLGVGKDYSTWVKEQIVRARLVEDRDYVVITIPPKRGAVGNRGLTKEYHLTLRAGQHVGMMSNSDKGYEIRDYFIECERAVRQLPPAHNQVMSFLEGTLVALKSHDVAIALMTTAVEEVKTEVGTLTKTMRLHTWQCYELKSAVTAKAQELHEKHDVAYQLLFPGLWGFVKRHFRVTTYNTIPAVRFDEACSVARNITIDQLPDYVVAQAKGVTL